MTNTTEDLIKRTTLEMRYLDSSSCKFFCHMSLDECMVMLTSWFSWLRTSMALAKMASLTARSSRDTTFSLSAVLSQMAISLLSSAMWGGSLFCTRNNERSRKIGEEDLDI